ncbi:hypothetical protein ACFL5P_03110 [candidate division KSB1 bacterium]
MNDALLYILIGFVGGIVFGWIIGDFFVRGKIKVEKRKRTSKRKARQLKIIEHFRIEVKNNTIRLKKEQKRLVHTKQLGEMDLLFNNHKKRLFKVSDKELRVILQDFYKDIFTLLSANDSFTDFSEKNVTANENLNEELKTLFNNSMVSIISGKIEKIIETGTIIVGILVDKLEDS